MSGATKVIVTHRTALKAKYGAAGWDAVRRAVRELVAADKARGVVTRLVALDAAPDMRRVGAAKVGAPGDFAAVKAAIDAVWAHGPVDYLVILGAPDVVPQVPLTNP